LGKHTRQVFVGGVAIGGGAPVSIQSMTNTDTANAAATAAQINALAAAGCDIARVSVYNGDCAKALRAIKAQTSIPLVADIHFDHRLAIEAMENGADKLRINPGNIGGEAKVRQVADCAKAHHAPIRIGVNGGSLEKELLERCGGPTPEAMVESARRHIAMLERAGFYDIVLSLKASSVRESVKAYQLMAQLCDYPLHIGITEAGAEQAGLIKSAVGLGVLLHAGIGDTLRVSLTGEPVQEVVAAGQILQALGLRKQGVEIISCPTCGRTGVELLPVVQRVRAALQGEKGYLQVAVMGCEVNGPGEARGADIGVAFGREGSGVLFKQGVQQKKLPAEQAVEELIAQAKAMLAQR
jgi:(E)-4-hydroxy-3-methylbut-2-enyl-diphosphate synthase